MSALFISKILDIPPEIVYYWWTDLQSTDSKLVKPLKSRKIISKSDDIIIEERAQKSHLKSILIYVSSRKSPPKE